MTPVISQWIRRSKRRLCGGCGLPLCLGGWSFSQSQWANWFVNEHKISAIRYHMWQYIRFMYYCMCMSAIIMSKKIVLEWQTPWAWNRVLELHGDMQWCTVDSDYSKELEVGAWRVSKESSKTTIIIMPRIKASWRLASQQPCKFKSFDIKICHY